MKAIKKFLRPNWWKVGILALLAGTFLLAIVYGGYPDLTGSERLYIGIFGSIHFGPVVMLWSFIVGGKGGTTEYALLWGMSVIYYYLLACLIYFITTKIKRLIARPK